MMLRSLMPIAALLLLTGCAGWREQLASRPTVADQRDVRREAAVQSFEQQRDAMQLQAALDRFDQGDLAGCESRLAALVQRRPAFLPARLCLAEITWSRGDAALAEQHYLALLSLQPGHAEAHHGLGLLLEAEGRFDEAAEHLVLADDLMRRELPQKDAEERR
jgi:Tfp pilus assembly protein PilF